MTREPPARPALPAGVASAPAVSKAGFYERVIGLSFLGVLIWACVDILTPVLVSAIWGITLAVATWPVFARLRRLFGNYRYPAAIIMALCLLVLFLAPLVLVAASLGDGVAAAYAMSRELADLDIPSPPAWLNNIPLFGNDLERRWARLAGNMPAAMAQLRPYILDAATWLIARGAQFGFAFLELMLAVLVAAVLYIRGEAASEMLRRFVARIAGPRNTPLVDLAARTIRGVANGVVGTALGQGLVAALGFAIADMPATSLLGLAVFFASVIQLPTQIVTLPVAVWAFYMGEREWSLFLLLWGVFAVGGIDNVLRPFLISQGARLPLTLVFAGVIGGLLAYGFVGIFIGPVILAVAWTLLRNWLAEPVAAEPPD